MNCARASRSATLAVDSGFRIPGVLKRGLALNLEDVTVKGQLQMNLYEA